MDLYNANEMPLSNDERKRNAQEKILKGEQLNVFEKIMVGRDHPTKELFGYQLKPDQQTDENTFVRNVWNNDLIVYSIVSTIHDNNSWETKDVLSDIVEKIYFKLDKIIHPDYRPGLDYEDTRYYVEVEYINKEKQDKMKSEHNMDFNEENWRA